MAERDNQRDIENLGMMQKAASLAAQEVTEEELKAINKFTLEPLKADEVFTFKAVLCDNEVDRQSERFTVKALEDLKKLFVGKTGIVDHRWSSDSQVARIFETQVVKEGAVSYIKAWAYIRRGGANEEVIADIEAGIKKEVSVGCAMGRSICSVCGSDYGSCGHQKGEHYDGQLCCVILKEPMDAYEFSFVAVPAQREAGVLKGMARNRTLKELAEEFGAQAEYRALFKEAQLGWQYRKELEDDVVRLCLSLELGADRDVLRGVVKCAAAEDLMKLKGALEEKLVQSMPVMTQLGCSLGQQEEIESDFLI